MTLIEKVRKGFDEIIQYYQDREELHSRAAGDAVFFAKYLENQTETTVKRLKDVIEKINYETIQPHEKYQVWPDLEFWRGIDDYGTSVALNYDGGVDMLEGFEPIIKGMYEDEKALTDSERIQELKNKKAVKIDVNKYPISLLGYYEYKFNTTALYYAWISFLWQEVEGYKCGIFARTLQNNSVEMFSLNDFILGDFSAFTQSRYGEKPPRVGSFFSRKLSFVELYLRASQTAYPYNPYNNYWRYFEKGNEFMEIVNYEFSTGIRTGKLSERNTAHIQQITKHNDSKSALIFLTAFTNKMIFEGWIEKLRPIEMPNQMNNNAYDFEIWTGINWTEDQKNNLPAEKLRGFEEKYKIKLPNSYFQYLRMLNGRQQNIYRMYFPVDDLNTINVKKFYNIDELDSIAQLTIKNDVNYLWIGELTDKKVVGIQISNKDGNYEKIIIAENGKFKICEYNFEKFAKFAQGSCVYPEVFAAEENDADYFIKKLNEGWDYNIKYGSYNAIEIAAEHNSHDVLEVLLKAGARIEYKDYRKLTWKYDEKTMVILDKYHKE